MPAAGSDAEAGYYYERQVTKHIPDDYLDNEEQLEGDDYIVALPNSPKDLSSPVSGTSGASNHYVGDLTKLNV